MVNCKVKHKFHKVPQQNKDFEPFFTVAQQQKKNHQPIKTLQTIEKYNKNKRKHF